MIQLAFWFAWCIVGLAAWSSWLGHACPPGACSGMLVAMQLFDVVLPFLLWLGGGIAISIGLAVRRAGADGEAPSAADSRKEPLPPPPVNAVGDEAGRAMMRDYGITHDGRQYQFQQYRYDRLADAVAYARLVRERGAG